MMLKEAIYSLRMFVVMTFVLGFVYPVALTGFAQVVFHDQANGSIIYRQGEAIGSRLIGQSFAQAGYFHGRPSQAGQNGYDAAASGGSNLGPTSAKLMERIAETAAAVRLENGLATNERVPSDLVTASGSGLDPHITPQAALLQAERVAKARNIDRAEVLRLIEKNTEYATLGFMGDARVNVLMLNADLDEAAPISS